MGSLRSFALAGVFAVACSATTFAADLLPPPPMAYPPPPVEVGGGWYLRGDVGVGAVDFDKFEGVNTNTAILPPPDGYKLDSKVIGDQAFVGVGIGYQFNHWLRGDVTAEYRTATQIKTLESYVYTPPVTGANLVEGKLSSIVGLVNGYFDLGTWHGLTPFVGAGVGFATHRIAGLTDIGVASANGGGFAADYDKTNLAWAVHAGIGYEVTPNLKLELGYRYLNMGDAKSAMVKCYPPDVCPGVVYSYKELDSHDIKLAMRWMLGGPVAAAMPAPLVRKY